MVHLWSTAQMNRHKSTLPFGWQQDALFLAFFCNSSRNQTRDGRPTRMTSLFRVCSIEKAAFYPNIEGWKELLCMAQIYKRSASIGSWTEKVTSAEWQICLLFVLFDVLMRTAEWSLIIHFSANTQKVAWFMFSANFQFLAPFPQHTVGLLLFKWGKIFATRKNPEKWDWNWTKKLSCLFSKGVVTAVSADPFSTKMITCNVKILEKVSPSQYVAYSAYSIGNCLLQSVGWFPFWCVVSFITKWQDPCLTHSASLQWSLNIYFSLLLSIIRSAMGGGFFQFMEWSGKIHENKPDAGLSLLLTDLIGYTSTPSSWFHLILNQARISLVLVLVGVCQCIYDFVEVIDIHKNQHRETNIKYSFWVLFLCPLEAIACVLEEAV